METIALQDARDKLGVLVAQAHHAHRPVTITRHGRPEAVLVSAEDYEETRSELKRLQDEADRRHIKDREARLAAGEDLGMVTISASSREELEAKLNQAMGLPE